jgi:hypothetical protein
MPEPSPDQSPCLRWESDGVTVLIEAGVVARISASVITGFKALPRRGAEVGGILLGSAAHEAGGALTIEVIDFLETLCEHRFGPSYVLSDNDLAQLETQLGRWAGNPETVAGPVGFVRSHTRDAAGLGAEDLQLLDSRFPGAGVLALLLRPHAAKPIEASYLLRRAGTFPSGEQPATPFVAASTAVLKLQPRQATAEPAAPPPAARPAETPPAPAGPPVPPLPPAPAAPPTAAETIIPPPVRPKHRYWSPAILIPLCLLFLVLGGVLGFQVGLHMQDARRQLSAESYRLGLRAEAAGEDVGLYWDYSKPLFRLVRGASLEIADGSNLKRVELRPEDLGRGGVLYRRTGARIRFRLSAVLAEGQNVVEELEFQVGAPKIRAP